MKYKVLKVMRGNYCSQLFVIEKGCIYVVPMPKKSDVIIAMKLFTNDIITSEPAVVDVAREETSIAVKIFASRSVLLSPCLKKECYCLTK